MLDLAPARTESVAEPPAQHAAHPAPAPSILSTRAGSPRLSTRLARPAEPAPDPAPHTAAPAPEPAEKSPRPSLGARIAEAMGRTKGEGDAETAPAPSPQPDIAAAAPDPQPVPAAIAVQRAPAPYPRLGGDPERPLLDPSILIGSVLRHWKLIATTTVLGAVGGVLLALSTPHRYYAENRLFIDPRELRLTEDDLRNPALSTEAMVALTDSQVQILTSTPVLVKVVDKLGLARDPEFNGSMSSGGISAGFALIKDLIRGKDSASESDQEAISTLRDSITVTRDPRTFVINVGTVTRDPSKSALIANTLVDTYLDEEGAAQSGLMESASEAIDTRLETLQADLNAAERAVEEFRARNDLVGVNGELLDDKQTLALSNQLAAARAQKVAVKVKADSLAKARFEDVLVGAFPEEFLSGTLIELRKQYSQAKATTDSLATRLGPRHPQFIAASSALESTRNEIRAELRRIVASSQAELQRAVQTEQELVGQLAVSKNKSLDNSVELVTLRELERKAAATRAIYEAFLKRSREASERGNLSTRTARVISPAEPPLNPVGPSRKIVAIAGMVGGMGLGIGIALLLGAVDSVRRYGFGLPRADRPAAIVPPSAPDPGPGGGSGTRARRPETFPSASAPAGDASLAAGEALIRAEAALTAAEEAHALRMAKMTEAHARTLEAALAARQPAAPAAPVASAPVAPVYVQAPAPAFAQAPMPPYFAPPPVMPAPSTGYVMTAYGPVPMMPAAPVWPQQPVVAPYPVSAYPEPARQTPAPEPAPQPAPATVTAVPAVDETEIARIRDDMRRLRERIAGTARLSA